VKEGKIKQGTVVLDSLTDLWSWIQYWGTMRLAKKNKIDPDTLGVKVQLDWKLMNGKHYRLITAMRGLLDYGINVVGTAREQKTPSYLKSQEEARNIPVKDRIRAQKDVLFWFSSIINLYKKPYRDPTTKKTFNKYYAKIEKLETLDVSNEIIENLNYEKLKNLISEERKKALSDKK
jgi:hypothetical protein